MTGISLDHWRAAVAVVDHHGFAGAAEALDKSQSAISYAVQKLESELELRIFKLQGRKAVLTDSGQVLIRRARLLLEEAADLHTTARRLQQRCEPQIRLAVDVIFPTWLILQCIARLGKRYPEPRIELQETVLSGTAEAMLQKSADLVIGARIPPGFLGEPLMRVRFIPVASPRHPLHKMDEPLTLQHLRRYRQLVIRDSGQRNMDSGWLGAEQRLTVTHMATSIRAVCQGMGFAWIPEFQDSTGAEYG